jgi:hypothetical protein
LLFPANLIFALIIHIVGGGRDREAGERRGRLQRRKEGEGNALPYEGGLGGICSIMQLQCQDMILHVIPQKQKKGYCIFQKQQ